MAGFWQREAILDDTSAVLYLLISKYPIFHRPDITCVTLVVVLPNWWPMMTPLIPCCTIQQP